MIAVRRSIPAGLALVAAALAGVVALEVVAWQQPETVVLPGRATTAAAAARPEVVDGAGQQNDRLNEILSRPLFNPDRRPAAAGVRGLPRLTGIVVNGSQHVAIFAGASGDHPIVAEAGAHVGAYAVRDIGDSVVTVIGPGGAATTIRPAFDDSRPAAPQPLPGLPQRARMGPVPK